MGLKERLQAIAEEVVEEWLQENDKEEERFPTYESAETLRHDLFTMLDGTVGDFQLLAKESPEDVAGRWVGTYEQGLEDGADAARRGDPR